MRIDYCVMDPTGNITILVETPLPPSAHPYVAGKLMEREPGTEQVGFVSSDDSYDMALRMAGGEFCGNASLCAAVYAAGYFGRSETGEGREEDTSVSSINEGDGTRIAPCGNSGRQLSLRVSGAPGPVRTEVKRLSDGIWQGIVDMPYPVSVKRVMMPEAGLLPVVSFDGISHVIIEEPLSCMEGVAGHTNDSGLNSDMGKSERFRLQAEYFARTWCGFLHADAVGLMFLDRNEESLTPLVYVPAADTLCWENSCASGTTACGVYLARESGNPVTVTLRQPGGSLISEVGEDSCRLKGTVRFLRYGHAVIEKSLPY